MAGRPDKVMIMTPSTPSIAPDQDILSLPLRSGAPSVSGLSSRHASSRQPSQIGVNFNSAQSPFQYSTYQQDPGLVYSDDEDDIDEDDDGDQTHPLISGGPNTAENREGGGHGGGGKKSKRRRDNEERGNDHGGAEFSFKPQSKYDMKNHMANERTFFKYLFTGLHIGSIGTLVLTFFPNDDINKLYLVIVIWLIAFAFMFWGLFGYYKRKSLMENGKLNDTNEISPHTPLLISAVFVGVILSVVWYGLFVHYKYESGITLSKLFMMSEKDTNARKKRRQRRQRRKQRAAAAAKDMPPETQTDGVVKSGNDGNEHHEPHQNEAAGLYNSADGSIIQPQKFDGRNGAEKDARLTNDNKHEENDNIVTHGASILPTSSDNTNNTTQKRPQSVGSYSNTKQQILNDPTTGPNSQGKVKIPRTSENGGYVTVDMTNFGKDDEEKIDDIDDDSSYELHSQDDLEDGSGEEEDSIIV